MSLGDKIDLSLALGTGLLAVATVFLALYTRGAVKEAAEARKTWASMALDTTRARLDAAAPAVNVVVHGGVLPKIFGWTQGAAGRYDNEWPIDHPWTVPMDNDVKVAIKFQVKISNDSRVAVKITCVGSLWTSNGGEDHSFILEPATDYKGQLESSVEIVELVAIHTVAEWLENYDAYKRGEALPHTDGGTIVVSDRNDNGVNDSWDLHLEGVPIVLSESNAGEARRGGPFEPPESDRTTASLSDRHRRYFISRNTGTTLPTE